MLIKRFSLTTIFVALISSAIAWTAAGNAPPEPDWPQWRGVDRTGLSRDTGLMKEWPKEGPPVIWSIKGLGEGYGSVSIKGDRIFVQGVQDGNTAVFCLNRAD